ncbi:amino acid permease domain-containing protein [Trichoderma chlorosporum]
MAFEPLYGVIYSVGTSYQGIPPGSTSMPLTGVMCRVAKPDKTCLFNMCWWPRLFLAMRHGVFVLLLLVKVGQARRRHSRRGGSCPPEDRARLRIDDVGFCVLSRLSREAGKPRREKDLSNQPLREEYARQIQHKGMPSGNRAPATNMSPLIDGSGGSGGGGGGYNTTGAGSGYGYGKDASVTDVERAPSNLMGDGDAVKGFGDLDGDLVTAAEERDLKRGLKERHLSMLGIAGAIGTGLFLGLGSAVQRGGPLGALLGYGTVGMVVSAVQFALGEVSALYPVTGSFVRHAEALVDPALGFAVGWNLVYGNLLSIPSEITAICVLFEYWLPDVNPSVWIVIFILLTAAVGLSGVRWFGEIEACFATLKMLMVIFFIVFGLVIDLGGIPGVAPTYFRFWKTPGPFVEYIAAGNWGRFLGYWSVMTGAVFSFAGVESLAMAGAETANPRKAIPRACRNVFIRILLFYMLAILIVGMIVSSDDDRLNDQSGTAAQSPFIIAVSAAGYPAVPSVINAIVITSAWSSSNQGLLSGSRVLYGLALKRQAPRVFLRTTSWGVPYVAVGLFIAVSFLSFMTLSSGALTAFFWLMDLVGAGVLVSWICIVLNHVRLRMALKVQGIPYTRLPWHNSWTLYSSFAALFMSSIILLTNGFVVFTKGNWSASGFVSAYLDITLVLAAYLIWKYLKKTKIVALKEIPLEEALMQAELKDAVAKSP